MDERASGIILRTRPLTETSLIVHLLTAELGRVALVAKGARRAKSAFAGKLDFLFEVDVSFARSRKSELHNLREVTVRDAHPALRRNLSRLNAAAYTVVLIEQATETETPVPEYYVLLKEMLETLRTAEPGRALIFSLEARFLRVHGAMPSLDALSPMSRKLMEALASLPLAAADNIPLAPDAAREIELFLRRAIGMAIGRIPPLRERLMH